jgi:polyhydroxyalkanoate synthesis regulator phasin
MSEILKKLLYFSIGTLALAEEKIEEIVGELIKKGDITEKEGKKLIEELIIKVRESKKELEERIKSIIEEILSKMNIPTKKDIEKLEKRLKILENMRKKSKKR